MRVKVKNASSNVNIKKTTRYFCILAVPQVSLYCLLNEEENYLLLISFLRKYFNYTIEEQLPAEEKKGT